MSEKCDLCIRKSEAATTAAKRHLHFLLGMLALVTLGLRSLLLQSTLFSKKKNAFTTDVQDPSPWPEQKPPTCKLNNTYIRKLTEVKLPTYTIQYLPCVQMALWVEGNSPEPGAAAVCTLTTAAPCFAFLSSTSNAGGFLLANTACELLTQGDWRIHSLNSLNSQHERSKD